MARRVPLLPFAFALIVFALGCAEAEDGSKGEEVLAIEEVGGPIDAELSTEDDPRGRRRSDSRRVLPPGFPADLPLPAGVLVTEAASKDRGDVVLFDAENNAEKLAIDWVTLLETEGWVVQRSGELSIVATRGERSVAATLERTGSGSRLRVEY